MGPPSPLPPSELLTLALQPPPCSRPDHPVHRRARASPAPDPTVNLRSSMRPGHHLLSGPAPLGLDPPGAAGGPPAGEGGRGAWATPDPPLTEGAPGSAIGGRRSRGPEARGVSPL